jgi:AcrR family transcriptional regulator
MQDKAPLPERAAATPKRAGRPPGRHPDVTRERILDVAEELFANNGYNGTSLRDVARSAELQTAAIGYHYPTKEELFDTVIRRRAAVMTEWRQRVLAEMRQRHGDAAIPLDELVRAYVQPFYESANHGDAGWRHYAALMGRLANSPMGTEVIARHYDATAGEYIDEFLRSLPGVAQPSVIDGTGRAQRLAGARGDGRPLNEPFSNLVTFLVSGFIALPAEPARRSRPVKAGARRMLTNP